jgi:hypothetical protein
LPRSVVTSIIQNVEISDILTVLYTAVEQDVDGNYVREFRVTGTPDEGQSGNPQVFVLRLKSPIKTNLELTTPALQI